MYIRRPGFPVRTPARTSVPSGRARGAMMISERLEDRLLLSVATDDCGCDVDVQRSEIAPAAAALSAAPPASPSRATVADVSIAAASADSDNTDPAAWQVWTGVDAAFLTARTAEGYRIVDIEVDATNPLRFTAALIHNSGSHGTGWWWYYGATAADVSQLLATNSARLTDIESYVDNGQQRYAVVMVPNTGAGATAWWWYHDVSSATVGNLLTQNSARLTDIDRHNHGNADSFDVIMVDNTGPSGRGWWYYYNATPNQISGLISANNARLVDIEPVDPGHFDVIMERSGVSAWWWYYGMTAQDAVDTALQNGARIFDIERYDTLGGPRYAALMVNNSNEVTTRVGEVLRQSNPTADTGLYLKQVGGPVLAGLRENDRFEPASMIKALLNLTAMRAVEGGQASLNDPLFMYYNPANPYQSFANPGNPDECPDAYSQTANNRALMTMQEVLERMMERSDNRATRTIDQRFGRPLINATADAAGMTNTDFASTLGCGVPGNYLTLVDAGKMYEGVLNNTLLTPTNANTYFRMMTDDNAADTELVPFGEGVFGPFQTVVRQEAAALLGKPESDPQVQALAGRFITAMTGAWKGGGYTLGSGTNWREVRTAGGYVGLPFWGDAGVNLVDYVYGIFIDNATVPQSNPDPGRAKITQAWNDSQGELLRVEIRKALATWRPTVTQVYVSNTAWTPAFKNYLEARNLGDSRYGYAVPGGANQLAVLPWTVNQVSIQFNQAMSVQAADLAIRGVNTANYPTTGFSYSTLANTATWNLTTPVTVDKLMLDLNGDGASAAANEYGLRLDGEWVNGNDAFPSGNGTQGGDFRYRLNVLTGDASRDGRVNSLDLSAVKQRLNTGSTDVGRTLYTPFADVTGDGRISSLDLSLVKQRVNRQLPAPDPTGATVLVLSAPAPAAAGALFGTRRLDDSGVTSEMLA